MYRLQQSSTSPVYPFPWSSRLLTRQQAEPFPQSPPSLTQTQMFHFLTPRSLTATISCTSLSPALNPVAPTINLWGFLHDFFFPHLFYFLAEGNELLQLRAEPPGNFWFFFHPETPSDPLRGAWMFLDVLPISDGSTPGIILTSVNNFMDFHSLRNGRG